MVNPNTLDPTHSSKATGERESEGKRERVGEREVLKGLSFKSFKEANPYPFFLWYISFIMHT
jgi:hypothetical protein